jgi:hypothetical protein
MVLMSGGFARTCGSCSAHVRRTTTPADVQSQAGRRLGAASGGPRGAALVLGAIVHHQLRDGLPTELARI